MTPAATPTRWARRWPAKVLWVFAAALLLKAAMPWLAGTAAQWQGKTTFEICSVHGVPMESAASDGQVPSPDHPSSHAGEHCALSAFGAWATAESLALSPIPVAIGEAGPPAPHAGSRAPDACASWIARLQHGPPAFA